MLVKLEAKQMFKLAIILWKLVKYLCLKSIFPLYFISRENFTSLQALMSLINAKTYAHILTEMERLSFW